MCHSSNSSNNSSRSILKEKKMPNMKILPGKYLEQIGKIKVKKENHMKFERKPSQKRMLNSLNAWHKLSTQTI